MGRKLYPPYIDGKVPAFCASNDGEAVLRVPFRHNRSVGVSQYKGMVLKVKTVSTNEHKFTIQVIPGGDSSPINVDPSGNFYVDFYLNTQKPDGSGTYLQDLTIGVYYKVQLAYIDTDDVIGYFSDVGVTKYTSRPNVEIIELGQNTGLNNFLYNYTGLYSQIGSDKDLSEKEYSYRFVILDENDNIFMDSGEQVHSSDKDTLSYESTDSFKCNKELKTNKKYRIKYTVKTNNGLEVSSPTYYLMKQVTVSPSLNATLHATADYLDGFINVYLQGNDDKAASGNFVIARSSSLDNYETWNDICEFTLNKEMPTQSLFKDFTIEQGISYCYSLQQFNSKGLYSNRMLSEVVMADYEDMFLYDGKRQLKIRFNPNVSSFKNDIPESKMDTIGSKYPFIFRNGNVNYKEFPITGLISYLADDQAYFLDKNFLGLIEGETTDLTSDNVRAERVFKLEVMEWLSNGEAKLFRSPTEGVYLVRILNSSLSPNAPTGRMLHTFNCTAYEINEVNYDNLLSYGLFQAPQFEASTIQLSTFDFSEAESMINTEEMPARAAYESLDFNNDKRLDLPYVYLGEFSKLPSDSIIGLKYSGLTEGTNMVFITIGRTQIYEINTLDNPIIGIYPIWTPNYEMVSGRRVPKWSGYLNYGYYSEAITGDFDNIVKFDQTDELIQIIGNHYNILQDGIVFDYLDENSGASVDISYNNVTTKDNANSRHILGLEDLRTSVGRFYWLKFSVRSIRECYYNSTTGYFFLDAGLSRPLPFEDIIAINVYADKSQNPTRYYDGRDLVAHMELKEYVNINAKYANFLNSGVINNEKYYWTDDTKDSWTRDDEDNAYKVNRQYKFSINHQDNNIDLKTIKEYIITDLEDVRSISIGRMLMLDCYYYKTQKYFSIEYDPLLSRYDDLKTAKQNYENNLIARPDVIAQFITNENTSITESFFNNYDFNLLAKYEVYLHTLEEALNEEDGNPSEISLDEEEFEINP